MKFHVCSIPTPPHHQLLMTGSRKTVQSDVISSLKSLMTAMKNNTVKWLYPINYQFLDRLPKPGPNIYIFATAGRNVTFNGSNVIFGVTFKCQTKSPEKGLVSATVRLIVILSNNIMQRIPAQLQGFFIKE